MSRAKLHYSPPDPTGTTRCRKKSFGHFRVHSAVALDGGSNSMTAGFFDQGSRLFDRSTISTVSMLAHLPLVRAWIDSFLPPRVPSNCRCCIFRRVLHFPFAARVPSFRKQGARQQGTAAATPESPPDIPEGAMVTCSADNTIRLWDLGALDGRTVGEGHSGR